MGRNASSHQQPVNPLGSPSVVGLDAGRELARRNQRRRRVMDSAATAVAALIGVAVLTVAVYVGYSIYTEQQGNDRVESELRRAELERQAGDQDVRTIIEDLEDEPIWNGPGNPSFGVGDG